MAQKVKVFAAKTDNLSSIPGIHIKKEEQTLVLECVHTVASTHTHSLNDQMYKVFRNKYVQH